MKKIFWKIPEKLIPNLEFVYTKPSVDGGSLPTLYLLHGQFDTEDDWWSEKGQLEEILLGINATPMLIVMPFCSKEKLTNPRDQNEPSLSDFKARFDGIVQKVEGHFKPDHTKKAILGISMGGKQALAVVLNAKRKYSALGVLSGKLQGNNYGELKEFVKIWPQNLKQELNLYFHYCGTEEVAFYENNKKVCNELGGEIRTQKEGTHGWDFWRPELTEFIRKLAQIWSS